MARERKKQSKHKRGATAAIDVKLQEKMFILYVNGVSLNQIAQKFGMSVQPVIRAKAKYKWEERKQLIMEELFEKGDKVILKGLLDNKEQQAKYMSMLLAMVYEDIQVDYENRNTPGYKRKIDISTISDFEKFWKTIMLLKNEGVNKSEIEQKISGEVMFSKEEKSLLLEALASGHAYIEDDDKKVGNA